MTNTINFKPDANGFPLILETKANDSVQIRQRIVHYGEIDTGDRIENATVLYEVDNIKEYREAKGVYEDERPTYYDMLMSKIGKVTYVKSDQGELIRTEILD